jgi:phosphoglycerate dehydrogenase-like enzyme
MKILIASSIDQEAIEKLKDQHDVICNFEATKEMMKKSIADREILIFRSGVKISAEVMECAPNLKLIIRAGSGIDNLDVRYILRRGIELVRIPGQSARAVAEMSFALLLALSRNLLEADRLMRQGKWAKYKLSGYLLKGKTLGIIGLGNIGLSVAHLGLRWGMKVIGCVEFPTQARTVEIYKRGIRLVDFKEVIALADYVSIHVPIKESTRNLINGDVLASMKSGSYIVNLARGGVVDEVALLKELRNGKRLRGAALDVHAKEGHGTMSPLAALSNVILTPHIGAMTLESQHKVGRQIIKIVQSVGTDTIQAPNVSSMYASVA